MAAALFRFLQRSTGFVLIGTWLALLTTPSTAAGVTSELQQRMRSATFEVVVPKQENPAITYEKALPWELVPYQQRNDKYWSIGTAFAIGANTYVTAGHVLLEGVGSLLGEPALRAADGTVFAIDQIQKFSIDEDFVVFSLRAPPNVTPLATNIEPKVDDEVFAVGNALGDGIVIRSGLFTSSTPEDQDGRWKWIRFSAAASPGNSGGPLLDAQGRVIGIVIAKSENENLNYALPITQALNAPDKQARFDTRSQFSLPVLNQPLTQTLKTSFALPKTFAEFAKELRRVINQHYNQSIAALLKEHDATLFPKGKGVDKLLSTQQTQYFPVLVAQNSNDEWTAEASSDQTQKDLPGEGFITTAQNHGVGLLRLHRPNKASDAAFYGDSKTFMDLFLSGERISRTIGNDSVRVTSLGKATLDEMYTDKLGRSWQLRSWPITFLDSHLVMLLLPTPDGYAGLMQLVQGSSYDNTLSLLRQLANDVQVSYWGSLPQWQAFVARKALLPKTLADSSLVYNKDNSLQFKSRRLDVDLGNNTFKLSDAANMGLTMNFVLDNNQLSVDCAGLNLYTDDNEKTGVSWDRRIEPAGDADREARSNWDSMRKLEAPFNSFPNYDSSARSYWISTAISGNNVAHGAATRDETAKVRYVVHYRTQEDVTPNQMSNTLRQLLLGTRILER
jgi:serine protease Do